MSAAAYPEPGESLGPYRVVRRIGFGGMGAVFEARDQTLDRAVALKVISPHLADDPGFRARFVREARAQASVRSSHVVTVYAHGEARDRLYIASELVDSGDLGRLLRERGAPSLPVALDILSQVATGLADAHAAGLVHRDIKPANVLLRWRGGADGGSVQAFLADFGIARRLHADPAPTRPGDPPGTPSYMAPELHTGGTADHRSDIYSLGCLLWAAITGEAPYAGTSDHEVATAHLERPAPRLAGTAAAARVNRILRRAMAKRPDQRYATAAEMAADLREARDVALGGGTAPRGAGRLLPLLLAAAGVAWLVGPGSGDGPAPAAADPSTSRTTAIASLERSLEQQVPGEVSDRQRLAQCVATGWIDRVGMETMADAGFFDDEWNYVDPPRESMTPAMRSQLTSTIRQCAVGSVMRRPGSG